MYYGKPDDKDLHFTINGYKCAVGVNFPVDISERSQFDIRMVKTKLPNIAGDREEDWEIVHAFHLIEPSQWDSAEQCMSAFLAEANPKLKVATGGGEVPELPVTFLERLEWLARYGLAFNAQTGEVYIK